MTVIAFYDHHAEPIVNQICNKAIVFANDLFRKPGRARVDISEICFWCAQDVAPNVGPSEHYRLSRAAYERVRMALDVLDRAVAV
jgi:hypothetical protein